MIIHNLDRFKNKLLVMEGEDHVSKSTIGKGLNKILNENGVKSTYTFQPGGNWGDLASQFRSYCKDKKYNFDDLTVLFLFLADRAEHISKVIIPELKLGHTVICDRWGTSTIIYQMVAKGLLKKYHMNMELAYWMNNIANHYVQPDYLFLVSRDIKEISKVINDSTDSFESANKEFKDKVHTAYEDLLREDDEMIKIEVIENDIDGTIQRFIDYVENNDGNR